eukprot:13867775-Ditylum_brightwellii.AAC.1
MVLADNTTIMWNKTILNEMPVYANQPDSVLLEEGQSCMHLIEISILLDANIVSKNEDKHTKYCKLEIAFKKNHKLCR